MERGCRGNIFSADVKTCPWVKHNWIWATIQDLHLYNIHLQNDIKELEEWRENDIFIMDEIQAKHSDQFDMSDMRRINYVRIHLKVHTLSDITTSIGDQIRIPAFNAVPIDSCSKAAYDWPNYNDVPSATDRSLWQNALKLTFTGGLSMTLLQQYQLGRWKHNSQKHITWWKHTNGATCLFTT